MKIHPLARYLTLRVLPLLALALGAAAFAQGPADPPSRVASLSLIEGSVAFAPPGETEWTDAVLNRPMTGGDRLWTDRGGRAELHLGSAALHVDGESYLDLTAIDDNVMQASLNEGTVNARVRELRPGENFEIDTPQLAFRAAQPGDYRIDVDPRQGTTRVTVRRGTALVYGAGGQAQQLEGPQAVTFAGRELERTASQGSPPDDGFDRWAADRNRAEDESIAARYIPREVVGYQQLDAYGSWAQDPGYGTVWYPRVTIADWAPYRYGHWEFIVPWGWTWVDDAPWGFAPFHYGRWAMIGSRWAWCPGRIDHRPVYAPALVAFVGGGSGVSFGLTVGSGPGVGWFPLAPGEAWRPAYRASPRYVTSVNRYVVVDGRAPRGDYANRHRPAAVTAVSMEDFSRGRPVHRHWQPVSPADLGRVQVQAQPVLPRPSHIGEGRSLRSHALPPPPLATAPAAVAPQPRGFVQNPGAARRDFGEGHRPAFVPRPLEQRTQEPPRAPVPAPRAPERALPQAPLPQVGVPREPPALQQQPRMQRDLQLQQERVQRDSQIQQQRLQREQERARREQQGQQERMQREQQQLQTQKREREHEREQQVQVQRELGMRQQQAAQERALRQQQAAQEQAIRQQQAAQERAARQQQSAEEQRLRQQQAHQPRPTRPAVAPEPVPAPGPARAERGHGRPAPQQRDDNRSQGDEGWQGRGHGRAG